MEWKLLEVQTHIGKKESFEEDTYIDRYRYLARRAKNEGRKRSVKQESDLSEIAKTDTSLFTILGQFGSPQFSIILKYLFRAWESLSLGPTTTVQKEVKGIYR